MKKLLPSLLCLVIAVSAPLWASEIASTNLQILLDKVHADKKLLVAVNMDLDDAQGKTFWPLYDSYQKELQALHVVAESPLNLTAARERFDTIALAGAIDHLHQRPAPGQVAGIDFCSIDVPQACGGDRAYRFHQGAIIHRAEGTPVGGEGNEQPGAQNRQEKEQKSDDEQGARAAAISGHEAPPELV